MLTPADGPPQEFYYDGKRMMAYSPADDLVALDDAPPTLDAALEQAFNKAAIYFPFSDLIVADPYKDITEDLKLAFVVGQSKVVDGTTTDIIALANDKIQAQLWIGADDKLPRLFRATFFDEPGGFRHEAAFSNWRLNEAIPADVFWSSKAESGKRIPFAAPKPQPTTEGKKP